MQKINYHHLYYFWMVAKEGGVARASEKMHLTQPTISAQLTLFEETIGQKLFDRRGRNLELNEAGRDVLEYAEEIFSIGRELTQYLQGRGVGKGFRLNVGISDVLPKLVVMELIKPALKLDIQVRLHCHQDKPERLMNELALHSLDLVLTTGPLPQKPPSGVFIHQMMESPMAVFGTHELIKTLHGKFPTNLNGAPFLLTAGHPTLRQDFDRWCQENEIWPAIRAEISDSALLKTFGGEGLGFFLAPNLVEDVVCRHYTVQKLGVLEDLRERFILLTANRKIGHPALSSIIDHARNAQW